MGKTIWFLGLAVVGIAFYVGGLGVGHYGDDLAFLFDDPASKVGYFFIHPNPFGFYRPLEGAFLAVTQLCFGTRTLPVHLSQLAMHILLCWVILVFMVRAGFSRLQGWIGSGFMLVSQANVLVVVSNDTFSQLAGTLFGCLGLWALCQTLFFPKDIEYRARGLRNDRLYLFSLLAFAVALGSKETSVSFLLLTAGLVGVKFISSKFSDRVARIGAIVRALAPFIVILAAYLLFRSQVLGTHPSLGEGRNEFRFGLNVPRNLALCLAAMSSPFSSVSVMAALKNQNYALVASYGIGTVLFASVVLVGLVLSQRRWLNVLIGILAMTAFFPMAVLNHVSEAHVYNSMPFYSILVGIGFGALCQRIKRAGWGRAACVLLICVCVVLQYQSVQFKISMMRNNGVKSAELLRQIGTFLDKVPENGELVLVNPPGDSFEYSVFAFRGFNVLALGLRHSLERLGRPDIVARIAGPGDGVKGGGARVMLTLVSDHVVQVDG